MDIIRGGIVDYDYEMVDTIMDILGIPSCGIVANDYATVLEEIERLKAACDKQHKPCNKEIGYGVF